MLDTGVTVGEIRGLLRSDLDLDAAQIQLGGPGSHLAPRAGRLTEETVETLRRYLERRRDETPELVVGRRCPSGSDLQVAPERALEALAIRSAFHGLSRWSYATPSP
jgi:integrase